MTDRLKVGVVGLGDIARKAYLPVLAARPDVELHLCTRDPAVLEEVGERYGVSARSRTVGELLTSDVEAVFVHAATAAHPQIVAAALESGRPVYVDKPLADSAAAAHELAQTAARERRALMIGFNRRYAPAYAALRDHPRDLIVLEKHRANQPAEPRRVIFDDFIHVVDTLRFLLPGEATSARWRTRIVAGLLEHVVLELAGDGFTALGVMNRVGGAAGERCTVSGGGRGRTVLELTTVEDAGDPVRITRPGGWTPITHQRGIAQACDVFLTAVRNTVLLTADDALATHDLCEQIVSRPAP